MNEGATSLTAYAFGESGITVEPDEGNSLCTTRLTIPLLDFRCGDRHGDKKLTLWLPSEEYESNVQYESNCQRGKIKVETYQNLQQYDSPSSGVDELATEL